MAYYDFLNNIFYPLFQLPPLLAVLIMAFLISLIIIIITKFTTDQSLMKKLKDDMKEHQKQLKEIRSNPTKAMELQKKTMEANMRYMGHSLKPTLITFIPIILIFGWMSSTFAYESIKPQQEFSVTAIFEKSTNGEAEIIVPEEINIIGDGTKKIENDKSTWFIKGTEGEHVLEIAYGGEKQQTSVLITKDKKYINPIKKTSGVIKSIQINYKKLVILPIRYKDWLGWLGVYIWSSILFTMALRKILNVY